MSQHLASYEDLQAAGHTPNPNRLLERLFWTLNGPIETNLFVLDDVGNPDGSREPYITSGGTGVYHHPISQEPLTEPHVSSISTSVYSMNNWAADWGFYHRQHSDPDDPDCVWEGELVVRCCGEDKPTDPQPLLIQASNQPYITVHDFVMAVHTWLLSRHQDVLACLNLEYHVFPLSDLKLAIDCTPLKHIMIEKEDNWILKRKSQHATYPPRVLSAQQEEEERELKMIMGITM